MRNRILAEVSRGFGDPTWLTTADVARMLGLSVEGVKWLARNGRLPHVRTVAGQRVFRQADVERVAAERTKARLTKPRRVQIGDREPTQLSLFGTARLRLVAGREAKE